MTTLAPPNVGTITRDDITALKLADDVTFHQHQGKGTIRCWLRTNRGGGEPIILTATQQRLFPLVDPSQRTREIEVFSTASGYDHNDHAWHDAEQRAEAFASVHGGYHDGVLHTIVDLLRADDVLSLHWRGDAHSNGYSKTASGTTEAGRYAGLHIDELRLVVQRGERRMQFVIDTSVCADNSARMVRRFG